MNKNKQIYPEEEAEPILPNDSESALPEEQNAVELDAPMPKSRINRAMEHQAKRNITMAVIGIIVIILLLAFFGVTALQKLSDFTVKTKDSSTTTTTVDTAPLVPPSLNSPFDATNSADVKITGQVQDGDSVKLYVNDSYVDKVTVKDDKTFTFPDVTLKLGMNTLKAKAVKGSKESDYSDEIRIAYYNSAPSLDISSPADGRTFSQDQNPILVSGKTDSTAQVTVNGYQAVMEPDGTFHYTLNLKNGDNDITIEAQDAAGNKTDKHLKVSLQ